MVGSIKMERRFAQRENVLLGYSPQRAFPKSDIDFHDVFGGPPRRSSTQDMRCGFTESMNSTNGTTREEEDSDSDSNSVFPRNPGCGLSEMPVFGEGNLTRRRYRSDDFFDDIFRGDHSLSTPRRSSDDAFGSTPGSRILSPARSVPTRADSFGGSVTAQLQFRHSSEAFQEEKEFRSAIRPSYRPSFLSSNFSLSSKGGSYMTKSGRLEYSMDIGGKVKKDLKNTEASSNSSRFHFSIYKWVGEGVSILMPHKGGKITKQHVERDIKTDICPRSNGRTETVNRANELQTGNWCDSDLHFLNHTISMNNEFPYNESGKQDKGSVHKTSTEERVEPCHIVKEAVISVPGSETINNIPFFSEREHYDTVLIDKREEIKPHTSSEIGICESTEKEIAMCGKEVERPDLKPLHPLLHDADERQGFDVIIGKHGGNDCMERKSQVSDTNADVSKNVKKHDEEIVSLNGAKEVELKGPNSQNSSRTSGETLEKSSVKGKVKEFVQMFNQEATSNPKVNIHTRSQSSRWKSTVNFREDDQGSANTTQTHGNSAHVPSVNKRKSPPNGSSMVDKNGEESEKQQIMDVLPTAQDSRLEQDLRDENSFAREDALSSSSKSLATNGNIDDIFLEDFMIEELSNDQDKPLKTENDYEDIQISDAKIREWSSGKEGNIRSLLSTLQYVLWTGSGWKPVRLVDIIEGSAVKRAYQKALLCLHPDKLQRKGAASHQQYIAETVFAILQEAWDDHFDSLGAI